MSSFMTGFQAWGELPVHPSDIERIEVIRGPGSTIYGTDALSGVINIITKKPFERRSWEVVAWGRIGYVPRNGQDSQVEELLQNSGGAKLAYNWVNQNDTLGLRVNLGFNNSPEWAEPIVAPILGNFHYSVMASMVYQPNQDLKLFTSISYVQTEQVKLETSPPATTGRNTAWAFLFNLDKERFFFERLSLKLEADARQQTGRYKALIPEGSLIELTAGSKGGYIERVAHAMLLLKLSLWEDRDILSIGGECTLLSSEQTGTSPMHVYTGLLLHNETRLLADSNLILNAGLRWEQIFAEEDQFGQIVYRHFSPRLALIWKPTEEHSIRISATSAFRSPTPIESFVAVRLAEYPDPIPSVYGMVGNPYLEPEELYSGEVGYRGLLFGELRVDAAAFVQRVERLIGTPPVNRNPLQHQNLESFDQLGVELALTLQPGTIWSAYLNYTFIYSQDTDTGEQVKDWPLHIYGVGAEIHMSWNLRLNLDAYLVFDYQPVVTTMLNISSGYPYNNWQKIQAADQALINLRLGKVLLKDWVEVFMMAKNLLGFFRDQDGLRHYPMQDFQPIGAEVIFGVQISMDRMVGGTKEQQ